MKHDGFIKRKGGPIARGLTLVLAGAAIAPPYPVFGLSAEWVRFLGGSLTVLVLIAYHWIRYLLWLRRPYDFHIGWKEARDEYKMERILKNLAEGKNRTVEIVARSCFRWLCGDERTMIQEPEQFRKEQARLQSRICEAIQGGGSIHFVVQSPDVPVPWFDRTGTEMLRKHTEMAIRSFCNIRRQLQELQHQKPYIGTVFGTLTMSVTSLPIVNSMTRFREGKDLIWLVFDVSPGFKDPLQGQSDPELRPFLIFRQPDVVAKELNARFHDMLTSRSGSHETLDLDLFLEKQKPLIWQEFSTLRDRFSHHSQQRNDKCELLARVAAQHFVASQEGTLSTPAPTCIQLLITNRCSTNCTMCDHGRMYNKDLEMDVDELRDVIDMIHDCGTRSVVISGGEPLARDCLFDLLEYAHREGQLRLGLLTNGVRSEERSGDGGQLRPLSEEEARRIKDTCEWVQLSIDGFTQATYERVRRGSFAVPLQSLRRLVEAGHQNLEVCYTIQKENVDEVISLTLEGLACVEDSVPIRFKFAHGTDPMRVFVCSDATLIEAAINNLSELGTRVNGRYWKDMVGKAGYFSHEDIVSGHPLKRKMVDFGNRNYECHVLRHTCKINANGDVYPCCFLFDDNCASSTLRSEYFLGTVRRKLLRDDHPDKRANLLATIWRSNKTLTALRTRQLPVREEACSQCTRHFYQNEFLNELQRLYERSALYGYDLAEQEAVQIGPKIAPLWL